MDNDRDASSTSGVYLEKQFQAKVGHKVYPDTFSFRFPVNSGGATAIREALNKRFAYHVG
jgi:hypothetical protein